jgi:dolichyl-phosphate beta-glucosyltransferase
MPRESNSPPGTSIVVPCFDEERRIGASLARILAILETREEPGEVVIVDDGSRDATAEVVRREFAAAEASGRLRLVRFEVNHGKGFAIREGFRAARGDRVLFTDADLSTPIESLGAFESRLAEGYDLVIASRLVEGARILTPQPWRRRLSGWVF